MSLHHGLTDLLDNHLTCFTATVCSSMVPGNLPSQLPNLLSNQSVAVTVAASVASAAYEVWYLSLVMLYIDARCCCRCSLCEGSVLASVHLTRMWLRRKHIGVKCGFLEQNMSTGAILDMFERASVC